MLKKIIIYILTLESKLVLKKYKPRIIAVTGSVGKDFYQGCDLRRTGRQR